MNNRLLNTPIPPATTNNLGRTLLPELVVWISGLAIATLLEPVAVAGGEVLHGQDVITVVFSTRVWTTVPDVTVENTRTLELAEFESAKTQENNVKKASNDRNDDKNFIAILFG
jgi:hypothetical protein